MTASPTGDESARDRYLSIEDGGPIELRVRGSRFLGRAWRTDDETAGRAALAAHRKHHFDATHHCWALRTGAPDRVCEHDEDDGEPAGTAGAPILRALRRAAVSDACVVVSRWFGGVKLGKGGLSRAYADAADRALAAAPPRVLWQVRGLRIACAYADLGAVETVLARAAADLRGVERQLAEEPRLRVSALRSRASALADALREATGARAQLEWDEAVSPASPAARSDRVRPRSPGTH